MTTSTTDTQRRDSIETTGLDGVVYKPTEADPESVAQLPFELVCVDYEGQESFPSAATLSSLAADHKLRVTTPVRADGFDPLGDDGLVDRLPAAAGRVLVAGHGAYLDETEQSRAVAPRLGAGDGAGSNRDRGAVPRAVGRDGECRAGGAGRRRCAVRTALAADGR